MVAYKEELLKQEQPDEEAVVESASVEAEAPRELTEQEKDQVVREELAQLRANLLAKKKREKKKVCCVCGVCECMCVGVIT